jgi:uncharacterized membrane protein
MANKSDIQRKSENQSIGKRRTLSGISAVGSGELRHHKVLHILHLCVTLHRIHIGALQRKWIVHRRRLHGGKEKNNQKRQQEQQTTKGILLLLLLVITLLLLMLMIEVLLMASGSTTTTSARN